MKVPEKLYYFKKLELIVFTVVLGLALAGLTLAYTDNQIETNYLQELEYPSNSDKDIFRLNSSEQETLNIENVYIYKKGSSAHLDNDSIVMTPKKGEETVLSRGIALPENQDLKIGVEAKNAALLIDQPVIWSGKDCGKSELILEAQKKSENLILEKRKIVDNSFETVKLDVSYFSGEKIDLILSIGERPECGLRKNKAVLISDFYLTQRKQFLNY